MRGRRKRAEAGRAGFGNGVTVTAGASAMGKVVAAGNRTAETQHRVAFAVQIAEHAQQPLLDIVQACVQ